MLNGPNQLPNSSAAAKRPVGILIKSLAEAEAVDQRRAISDALVALNDTAVDALAVAVAGERSELAIEAAWILGHLQVPAARQWLLSPALGNRAPPAVRQAARRALAVDSGVVPTPAQAAAELYHAALQYDQQPPALPPGPAQRLRFGRGMPKANCRWQLKCRIAWRPASWPHD